jgi:hypothetical protein
MLLKLCHALHPIYPGKKKIILQHENTWPTLLIYVCEEDLEEQLPYRPDLAFSDYCLFRSGSAEKYY